MRYTRSRYVFLSILGLISWLCLAVTLILAHYVAAWVFALVTVGSMEGRVQSGGRVPHDWIFWTHIVSAVPFLVGLSVLAYANQSVHWIIGTLFFFVGMSLSGAVLWYRGLKGLKMLG